MASRIKGITVEIGGDTTGLQTALKQVNNNISTTQSALKDVNKLLKLDPTNTELLSQKQKLLKTAISETSEKLETLKIAQEQAKKQMEEGTLGKEKYDALCREIEATEQQLKSLKEQAEKTNTSMLKLAEVGDKMKSAGDKITSVGKTVSVASVAVAGLGTAAVKTTADFESSMSQVQATMGITKDSISKVNGQSVNTMSTLSDLAKKMGSETAFSASECAEALNYLALAGYDTEKMCKTLPTVLNLAAAGNMNLATASDMVTDAMSALGVDTKNAKVMVDQMAKAASSSNTSVSQLGEAMLTVGGTAKNLIGGTAELSTALGILANNGIKASEGGTHLRNILLALQKAKSDDAAAYFKQLGINAYDASGNLRPLNDILVDLKTSMAGMSEQEKNNALTAMFNKTDLASIQALLSGCGDEWDDLQSSIINSSGAADEMANTQLDNLNGQITILKSALEGLAISFGEVLMPMVKSVVEKIQSLVTWFNNLSVSQKEVIVKIGLFVAALGPALIILGSLISSTGTVISTFAKFGTKISGLITNAGGLSGVMSKVGTAIMGINPIVVAVAAAIAVLIAAFVNLWNNNEEFRNNIIAIWNEVKKAFTDFADGIKERLSALGLDFTAFKEAIKKVWDGFCNLLAPVFEGAFKQISNIIKTVLDVVLGIVDVFIGLFTGDFSKCFEGVKTIVTSIMNGVLSTIKNILETIKGIVNVILSWFGTSLGDLKTKVTECFNNIKTTITNVLNAVKTTFTTIWNAIKTFLSTTLDSIKNTVNTVFTAVKTTITNIFNSIKTTITTIWNGIKNTISSVINSISSSVSSVFNNVKNSVVSVFNSLKSSVTSIWNGIKSAITSPINSAWETVKSAVSKISNLFKNTSWSLPKIKLPHFSITGKFSLNPPSIPKFSVSWYKDGGILDGATIFGMMGNTMLGGGEAGKEAVLPLSSFYEELDKILSRRLNGGNSEQYLKIIAENSAKGLYLDDGTLVGHLLPEIDNQLGAKQNLSRRLALK